MTGGTIHEVLERTAGRTIFVCMHARTARRIYDDMCEVCWDCRSVRGKTNFGTHWPAVTRIQLADGSMTATDGRSVAHDWRDPINPVAQAARPSWRPSPTPQPSRSATSLGTR